MKVSSNTSIGRLLVRRHARIGRRSQSPECHSDCEKIPPRPDRPIGHRRVAGKRETPAGYAAMKVVVIPRVKWFTAVLPFLVSMLQNMT
jgi:hypothetical protein